MKTSKHCQFIFTTDLVLLKLKPVNESLMNTNVHVTRTLFVLFLNDLYATSLRFGKCLLLLRTGWITFYSDTPSQRWLCDNEVSFGVIVARNAGHICRQRNQETPFRWRGVVSLFGNDKWQTTFFRDDAHLLFSLTVGERVCEEQVIMRHKDPVTFAGFSERQLLCDGWETIEILFYP